MMYVIVALVVLTAIGAVLWPILQPRPGDVAGMDDDALEHRIASYRAALKADTVCDRCLRDNPDDAKYCADCGRQLHGLTETAAK